MKRILITVAAVTAAALAVSCQKEEPKADSGNKADFYASLEGPETKLQVSGQGYVYWDGDESISVNGGIYVIEDLSSPTSASFVYEKGPVPEEGRPFCAFYPSFLQSTDSLGILPEVWEYVPGSVTTLPMYAYSENRNLKFRNVCAALKISVDPEITVARLEVAADKPISGGFVVRGGDSLVLTGAGSGDTVLFDCGEGVPGTDFFVPIPAGYYGDIDVTVYDRSLSGELSVAGKMKSVFQHIRVYNNTIYPVEFDGSDRRDLLTDADCEEQCQAVYDAFARNLAAPSTTFGCSPLFAAFNLCADDVHVPEYEDTPRALYEFNTFVYGKDNAVVGEAFYGIVKTICEANSFLKLWSKKDGTTQVMKRCVAEVRVIRAYLQVLLSMGWENAPRIDYDIFHTSGDAIDLVNGDRTEVLIWCANECKYVISDLSERQGQYDKNTIRIHKGFAQAVAGMAYLYGSKYSEATTVLKMLCESMNYALVPGGEMVNNLHAEGNGNSERIFELVCTPSREELALFNPRTSAYVADPAAGFSGGIRGYGYVAIEPEFAHVMLTNDRDSYRRKATFLTSDETFYDTELAPSLDPELPQDLEGRRYYTKLGIQDTLLCGSDVTLFKSVGKVSDIGARRFKVMTLADAYLMYAEANIQSGNQAEGKKYLNKIQERSGSENQTEGQLSYLKEERKYELFLDGRRWIDIVRWGDAKSCIDKVHDNIPVCWDEYWQSSGAEAHKLKYEITHPHPETNFSDKYLHFPYPDWFLEMCPNVKQSSGWK